MKHSTGRGKGECTDVPCLTGHGSKKVVHAACGYMQTAVLASLSVKTTTGCQSGLTQSRLMDHAINVGYFHAKYHEKN